VAAAGIVTVIRALPTMYASLVAVLAGLGGGAATDPDGAGVERTDRDIPGWVVIGVPVLVVLTLVTVPGLLAGDMGFVPRLVASLGVAVFGTLFVVVSSRIVGLIGVSSNPTSGMTLVTLLGIALIFVLFGWTDVAARGAVLTVGTVVCVAASKAGDISQDLKTGFLVGATPARQQLSQFLAAAFACWAVAGTVLLLGEAFRFGSAELPAPQATLMKTVVEGVLAGALPWGLVGSGAAFSLCGMLAGLPGLPFAVGIYLPLASLTPIFVGGLVRRAVEGGGAGKKTDSDPGVLAASGMIAGEGLAGVALALLVGVKTRWPDGSLGAALVRGHVAESGFQHLGGALASGLGLLLLAAVAAMLFRAGRSGRGPGAAAA
jgi:putative OPT family oligopeptide transporter